MFDGKVYCLTAKVYCLTAKVDCLTAKVDCSGDKVQCLIENSIARRKSLMFDLPHPMFDRKTAMFTGKV